MLQMLHLPNFRRKSTRMSDMKVFETVSEFKNFRRQIHPEVEIGFVPTMGALHQGHASLIEKSASENDLTFLSIFVNPTQFNDSTDFDKYPKTWQQDLDVAAKAGVDVIFAPKPAEIYADKYRYKVTENEFSNLLCGAHRPGHFDGVLTVVLKLLLLTQPTRAYFGEKDYQQLQLIKDMVSSFFIPTEIISCKTLREPNGLALSSRNTRLSESGRVQAAAIFKTITASSSAEDAKKDLTNLGFEVDFVEDHKQRRFVAASIEGVRLIDNVELK